MKKLLFAFLLVISFAGQASAQTFQGVIKFNMNLMGENAAMAQAFMPTGFTYTVGKADMRVQMEGGMMAAMMGNMLMLGKKGETWLIKEEEETAYKLTGMNNEEEKGPEPVITKEDETLTIAGYECQKYKIETELGDGMGTATQYVWVTKDIQLPKLKSASPTMGLGGGTIKGIEGLPLKTMISQMGITVVLTCTEVDKTPPAKNALKLPKGYKKDEMDIKSLFGGMGGM